MKETLRGTMKTTECCCLWSSCCENHCVKHSLLSEVLEKLLECATVSELAVVLVLSESAQESVATASTDVFDCAAVRSVLVQQWFL